MIEIDITRRADSDWDKRMLQAGAGTYNQTAFFSELYSKYFGSEPRYMRIIEGGEYIGQFLYLTGFPIQWMIALDPIRSLNREPINRLYNAVFANEAPALFKNMRARERADIYAAIAHRIIGEEKPRRMVLDMIDYSNISENLTCTEIAIADAKCHQKSTAIIDFSQIEKIDAVLRGKWAKYTANRSARHDIEIREAKSEKNIDEFYRVFEETRKRNRIKIYSKKDYFRLMWHLNKKYRYLKLFIAYAEGEPLAAQWFSTFNGYMVEFGMSISDYAIANKIYANDFMQYGVLKYGLRNRMKVLDFVGFFRNPTDQKQENINHFRKKWMTRVVDYPEITL